MWWCAIGADRGTCAHAGYQVLFPFMPPEDNYSSSDVEKVGVLYHSSFSRIVKCPNFYSRSAGSVTRRECATIVLSLSHFRAEAPYRCGAKFDAPF
jgi:hypothetical protein